MMECSKKALTKNKIKPSNRSGNLNILQGGKIILGKRSVIEVEENVKYLSSLPKFPFRSESPHTDL